MEKISLSSVLRERPNERPASAQRCAARESLEARAVLLGSQTARGESGTDFYRRLFSALEGFGPEGRHNFPRANP